MDATEDEEQRREVDFVFDDSKRDVVRVREMHVVTKCTDPKEAMKVIYHYSGARVHEAAVVMARWVYDHPDVFVGKRVMELGAGCGLVGLVSAYFASQVYLTDRIPLILNNLQHNVSSNKGAQGLRFQRDISQVAQVLHLEWDDADPTNRLFDPVDIAVGSEILYLASHVDLLLKVLDTYLLPGGSFFQVCAHDRKGLEEMRRKLGERGGYQCDMTPISDLASPPMDDSDSASCCLFYDREIHVRRFTAVERFCFVRITRNARFCQN